MTTSELEELATRLRSEVVEKEEPQTHSDSDSDSEVRAAKVRACGGCGKIGNSARIITQVSRR